MEILESFINWIQKVAQPLIDLYNEDSSMFFIGAIIVILILLIIIIALARRKDDGEGRPSKKIKYQDIDWSIDGEEATSEAAPSETANVIQTEKAAEEKEPAKPVAEEKPSEEPEKQIAEELRYGSFDVPLWMTKHTISIDQANSIDAQEWLDQELAARHTISQKIIHETERHAEEIGKLAHEIPSEKLVCFVSHEGEPEMVPPAPRGLHVSDENVFVVSENDIHRYTERYAEPQEETPAVEVKEPPVIERIIPSKPVEVAPEEPAVETPVAAAPAATAEPQETVIQEPETQPVSEPAKTEISPEPSSGPYESGTLAKILREAEELKASQEEQVEEATAVSEEKPLEYDGVLGLHSDEEPSEAQNEPAWNFRETLRRLESMQEENESMAREIGLTEERPAVPEEPKTEVREEKAPGIPEILLRPNNILPVNEELESNLKQEYEQMIRGEDAIPSVTSASSRGDLNDSIDLHTSRIRRFGPNNRDTNRSGRKFTEEELMKQIRD